MTFQPTVKKIPPYWTIASGFQATHLNNRKQKMGSHLSSRAKGRHRPWRQEREGGGGAGPSADPLLMSVQRGLFSSALRSERPPGDLRSERCSLSQDEAIFNRFYEMSIPTPRTGHRSSDCTFRPLWVRIFSLAFKDLQAQRLLLSVCIYKPRVIYSIKNAEKLQSCSNLTLKICF